MIKVAQFIQKLSKASEGALPRWLIVTGEEEFLRAEAKQAAVANIGGDVDVFDFNWEAELSGDEGRLTLFDELRTASLFGEPKLVVIKKASKFLKEQAKAIARFAAEEDPQAWVIFEDDSIVKRKAKTFTKPVQALVDAGAEIVDCGTLYASSFGFGKPVWESELSRWVANRAKSKGKQLSLEDAFLLHSREASGLRGIAAQLDKIILSVADAPAIRATDIEKHMGDDAEASIFEAVDAFAGGDYRKTMSAVDRLFRNGIKDAKGKRTQDESAIAMRLLSMISTRMRELGRIFELKRDGQDFNEACGAVVGKGRRFLFPKIQAQLQARSPRALGQTVVDLENLDRSLKSGGGHPRDLFVFFLFNNMKAPAQAAHPAAKRFTS